MPSTWARIRVSAASIRFSCSVLAVRSVSICAFSDSSSSARACDSASSRLPTALNSISFRSCSCARSSASDLATSCASSSARKRASAASTLLDSPDLGSDTTSPASDRSFSVSSCCVSFFRPIAPSASLILFSNSSVDFANVSRWATIDCSLSTNCANFVSAC